MTTTSSQPMRASDPSAAARGSVSTPRQLLALARAETTLLLRNRTALFNSLLLPVVLVVFLWQMGGFDQRDGGVAAQLVTTMATVGLLFVTYYNLVTTYVARREEYVLKRMRTGEAPGWVTLAGSAVPTVLVSIAQLAIVTVAVGVAVGLDRPVNLLLPVLAYLLGTVLFGMLAAASTAFTKTTETAQITTLPVVVIGTALSGVFFPLSLLPDTLATVARFTPAAPVVELFQLGLSGITADGETVSTAATWGQALVPLAVLAGWTVVATWLSIRFFRWEPRRG